MRGAWLGIAAALAACHGRSARGPSSPAAIAPGPPRPEVNGASGSVAVAQPPHDSRPEIAAGGPEGTPAFRYGMLDAASCEAELGRRAISHVRVPSARGVLMPLRLTGALRGVAFHGVTSKASRATSPYEIMDCRLALALDDLAAIVQKHTIVEVVHMSAYRPPPTRGWTEGAIGKAHGGALALDAGTFVRKDGSTLVVERDFHGRIGASTCNGAPGPNPPTPEAVELRAVLCEIAEAHIFNVTLTPNYNAPHRNHFHLEVTAGVRWFVVH